MSWFLENETHVGSKLEVEERNPSQERTDEARHCGCSSITPLGFIISLLSRFVFCSYFQTCWTQSSHRSAAFVLPSTLKTLLLDLGLSHSFISFGSFFKHYSTEGSLQPRSKTESKIQPLKTGWDLKLRIFHGYNKYIFSYGLPTFPFWLSWKFRPVSRLIKKLALSCYLFIALLFTVKKSCLWFWI